MEHNRRRRLVELGKNILIIALSCSALYLTYRSLLVGGLAQLWQGGGAAGVNLVAEREQSSIAWPVRMAVSSWDGESMVRYGVQYSMEECDEQFQAVASLLREALSSPGSAREVGQKEWRQALGGASNLYFDLLGKVPLPVLAGWLSGTDNGLSDSQVRRLVLAQEDEQIVLYYRDEDTGTCYARGAEVVSAQQFDSVIRSVTDNGALFAFEQERYGDLDGDTMILPNQPQPAIYSAVNPLAGGGQAEEAGQDTPLAGLLLALSFPDSSYIYSGTDQVIRSGSDTLRVSAGGVVRYNGTEGESSRYLIPSKEGQPTLFEVAEACRWLADGTVGAMAGEARLYLREIRRTETGWQIDFGYCLDGVYVQVGDAGYAAHFIVEGDEITQFILQLRSYADTGERSIVLPEQQAMAAMSALGKQGGELMLAYRDTGADTVSAGWVAD